jgi:hypothetical protein
MQAKPFGFWLQLSTNLDIFDDLHNHIIVRDFALATLNLETKDPRHRFRARRAGLH